MGKRKVQRQCRACNLPQPDRYGIPDPCLGWLEGVRNACCGHGSEAGAYVQYPDGRQIGGQEARREQMRLGGNPAPFDTKRYISLQQSWPPTG